MTPRRVSSVLGIEHPGDVRRDVRSALAIAAVYHRRLPARVDREEIDANARLGLAIALGSYVPARGSWFNWLYYCVRREIIDGARRELDRGERPQLVSFDDSNERPGPELPVDQRVLLRIEVAAILGCATDLQARALVARALGFTDQEIAEVEGVTKGAIVQRRVRMRGPRRVKANRLTPVERETLRLVVEGFSNAA